jgi:hypothetical protein
MVASSADAAPSRPRRRAGSRSLPVPPRLAGRLPPTGPTGRRRERREPNRALSGPYESFCTTAATAARRPGLPTRPAGWLQRRPRRTARCARPLLAALRAAPANATKCIFKLLHITSHLYISFTYVDCILNAGGLNTHMNHMSRDQPSAQEFTKYIAHPSPAPGRLSALAI